MKLLIGTILLLAQCAFAQNLKTDSNLSGAGSSNTNIVAVGANNQYSGDVVFTGGSSEIWLMAGASTLSNVASTVTAAWDVSIDGKKWITNRVSVTFTVGVNGLIGITNLPSGYRFPYYRAANWNNTNAVEGVIFTNLLSQIYFR